MGAVIEILCGAARTGKTSRALTEYRTGLRQALQTVNPGKSLWLSPTARAARLILESLPDESLPVCFAPNVVTFDAFAEHVLVSTHQNIARLSELGKRTLLRRIIDDLQQQNALTYFAPIARTAGFLDLVVAFVSELKRAETWPEHFEKACRLCGETTKDRDLRNIYTRYQRHLLDLRVYDAEGRFWSARNTLEQEENSIVRGFELVVVDGFSDFTHTQYEILGQLAKASEQMIVSLPLEEPLLRDDLFAKSRTARDRIAQLAETGLQISVQTEVRSDRTDHTGFDHTGFDHIADCLFADPRRIERAPSCDGLEIVAASGQLREVEMLAERIKRKLQSGVKPHEMVVAFRTLDDYADLIDEVFTAAGLPFWCEAGRPLSRVPIIKALFAILRLEIEDWPFEGLMSVLHSNYFRPDWDECRDDTAPRAVGVELRRLKIHTGRAAILRALQRKVEYDSETSHDSKNAGSTSTAFPALQLLNRLAAVTKVLRGSKDFSAWVETLVTVASELGIAPPDTRASDDLSNTDPASADQDFRCWALFEDSLFTSAELARSLESDGSKLTLSEFEAELRDLVDHRSLPPAGNDKGRVAVLAAENVRNLDIEHLFLSGLTEASFPRRRGDDCLYSESERLRLNEQGLSLGHRSSHAQDEMLLFYSIVTRAQGSMILSYPALNSKGQPLFPSPYLSAVRDLFDTAALPTTHVDRLDPVPPEDRILSMADWRLLATNAVRDERPELFRALLESSNGNDMAENILASVDMNVSRFHTRGFTNYEGLLDNKTRLDSLQKKFGPEHEFSATRFEAYAACPFRFLLSDVLDITPLESVVSETDFRRRGILVHDILSTLHGSNLYGSTLYEQSADGSGNSLLPTGDELVARFRELVDIRLKRQVHQTELQRVLAEIEAELFNDWSTAYAEQHDEYIRSFSEAWDTPPMPHRLEAPFGSKTAPKQQQDTQQQDTQQQGDVEQFDSLTFGSGSAAARVQGRIDRIDVGRVDGQRVANVIDYKTGKPPRFNLDDVRAGRSIQMALYALALDRLQMAGPDTGLFQIAYWSLKENGFVQALKLGRGQKLSRLDETVLESLEQLLDEVIPKLATGIRSGHFPVESQDPKCTGSCPYSTVCRVNQIRPLQEKLEKRFAF